MTMTTIQEALREAIVFMRENAEERALNGLDQEGQLVSETADRWQAALDAAGTDGAKDGPPPAEWRDGRQALLWSHKDMADQPCTVSQYALIGRWSKADQGWSISGGRILDKSIAYHAAIPLPATPKDGDCDG